MDTTTAAAQAGVTVDTIRHWCRLGAVAATKTAGRWIISAASLARRIALGTRHTQQRSSMDLTATYTHTYAGDSQPTTITPKIKQSTSADGENLTIIRQIAPLLADQIDAITDDGDRGHTLVTLRGANIVISDQPRPHLVHNPSVTERHEGRIATTYQGSRHITPEHVLDVGEQIRTHLGL